MVLHPKGQLQVSGLETLASPLQCTWFQIQWRVVELWKLAAEDLLAADEVGLIPWVPLAQTTAPPEVVLQECRVRIDRQAPPDERANLLAVTQVLARLRYNVPQLLAFFGGSQAMIESPLIQEITEKMVVRAKQSDIVRVLNARFKAVPEDVPSRLRTVTDLNQLDALIDLGAQCSDLEAFRAGLN